MFRKHFPDEAKIGDFVRHNSGYRVFYVAALCEDPDKRGPEERDINFWPKGKDFSTKKAYDHAYSNAHTILDDYYAGRWIYGGIRISVFWTILPVMRDAASQYGLPINTHGPTAMQDSNKHLTRIANKLGEIASDIHPGPLVEMTGAWKAWRLERPNRFKELLTAQDFDLDTNYEAVFRIGVR